MGAVLKAVRKKVVIGDDVKAILERSGVRAFLGTLISVVVMAWSKDESVVVALKQNAETLMTMLLLALGLSASPSKKG